MLTFPNIFNNIIGLFPDVFAKDASGAGSTDGTEYKKTVVDELLFGWIQAVLDNVSQTPNGVAETSSTSQIFDAMREAFSTPESQVVAATGAIVLGKTDHKIELDVSVGNISVTLPAPDFIGQKLYIFSSGSGIADITGTGLYANKIFQTSNTGVLIITATSITDWGAAPGGTADYEASTNSYVKQYSNGSMTQKYRPLFNFSSSTLAQATGSYSIPFSLIESVGISVTDTTPTCGPSYSDDTSLTNWTHNLSTFGSTTTAGSNGRAFAEGKY